MDKEKCKQILKENLKDGFVQIPTAILESPDIDLRSKALYAVILKYFWDKGFSYPSHTTLARLLGISRSTVIRLLKILRRHKLIDWIYRGYKRTNIYFVMPIASIVSKLEQDNSGVANLQQELVSKTTPQYVSNLEHKVYEVNNKKINNIKTFKRNFKNEIKLGEFDKQAEFIANELNDLKNLKYYISLELKIKNGLINVEQVMSVISYVHDKFSEDLADGKTFWKNKGAMYASQIKTIIRRNSKNSYFVPTYGNEMAEMVNRPIKPEVKQLADNKTFQEEKKPDINQLRNAALDQIDIVNAIEQINLTPSSLGPTKFLLSQYGIAEETTAFKEIISNIDKGLLMRLDLIKLTSEVKANKENQDLLIQKINQLIADKNK